MITTKPKVSRQFKWQRKRTLAGVCYKCGEPVKAGYKMCVTHLEWDRARKARQTAEKVKAKKVVSL